ncbi:MAG: aspartate/glutamate racemase family protein [Prevotellaceae bacterium]|jgi:glutamate racemase|nr:aspartate/glutamate racemase family protein [Prevotellaceae bacterium]
MIYQLKNRTQTIAINICLAAVLFFSLSCNSQKTKESEDIPIISKILSDKTSKFYIDFEKYPKERKSLAIGIFDSGTGGLTVLEKFLVCDEYNNATGEIQPDGIPDFENEDFNYLGDIANMPYGNYSQENKTEYLRELIIKDALFLLKEKSSKIIVVACNTATAYGLEDISVLLKKSGTNIHVIGVINAGVNATLLPLNRDADYAIGVLATAGTIASNAYEKTILKTKDELGFTGNIIVVNQSGAGFAESVDGEKDYTDRNLIAMCDNYRGPKCGDEENNIKDYLMDVYNFDLTNGALFTKQIGDSSLQVQLNSSENYARFHLVSLIEKYRLSGNTIPLKRIILGCTHYPYLLGTLNEVISELRNYTKNGEYIYKNIIADDFEFIDPALFTAKECYEALKNNKQLASQSTKGNVSAYISIPAPDLSSDKLNEDGSLSYDFKYGRIQGTDDVTTIVVPFSAKHINNDVLQRLEKLVPYSYALIRKTMEN